MFSRESCCRKVVRAGREHSLDVGIRYGATLQSMLRIRSNDLSAHRMLRGEIVDHSRTHRAWKDPNAMQGMQCI